MSLCEIARYIEKLVDLKINIVGFDNFSGLPPAEDFRDHPEIWFKGEFATVNQGQLVRSLPGNARIEIGDVRETTSKIIASGELKEFPLGFCSIDLDYYSSSIGALEIFGAHSKCFLPSVLMYFDDIDGGVTMNSWCGEMLAINEFNEKHEFRKIERKVGRSPKMFCCHVLDHPVRVGSEKPLIPMRIYVVHYQ